MIEDRTLLSFAQHSRGKIRALSGGICKPTAERRCARRRRRRTNPTTRCSRPCSFSLRHRLFLPMAACCVMTLIRSRTGANVLRRHFFSLPRQLAKFEVGVVLARLLRKNNSPRCGMKFLYRMNNYSISTRRDVVTFCQYFSCNTHRVYL